MTSAIPDDLRALLDDDVRRIWCAYATTLGGTLAACPWCGSEEAAAYTLGRLEQMYRLHLDCARCHGRLTADAQIEDGGVTVRWTSWDEEPPTIRRCLEAAAVGPATGTPWDMEHVDPDGDVLRRLNDTYASGEPRVPRVLIEWPHGSSPAVLLRLLRKLTRRLEAERASADLEDSGHAAA